MAGEVICFGEGVPLDGPLLAGLAGRDVTRARHDLAPDSRIAPFLEPFLDPFVRSFLAGLETGAHADAALALVAHPAPGAVHAYRYAVELRRKALLPPSPPLHLWNRINAAGEAGARFAATEDARVRAALSEAGIRTKTGPDDAAILARLDAAQAAGEISGAAAFGARLALRAERRAPDGPAAPAPTGPRLALAGAPLGNTDLHAAIDAVGTLVLDLQGPDADPPRTDDEVVREVNGRGVEALLWQVDPHDDLHGWRMPALRDLCARLGIAFVDLGPVSPWPAPAEIARAEALLAPLARRA